MPRPRSGLRWSFQTKVLVPVLVSLALVPIVTLTILNRHMDEQMRTEARQ